MTTKPPTESPSSDAAARRFRSTCLAIFLVALAIRGLYLLELAATPLVSVILGDGRQYYDWALEIARGDWVGHEAFYQAPLYPYALAVLVRLVGPDLWPIRLLQILLGSFSCVLVAVAGRRFVSRSAGVVAGAVLAVYPPAIFFDGLIQKTSFSLFFTAALLALVGELSHRVRWSWLVLSGVTLGCLALTRENALILVPVVGGWVFVHFRDVPRPERVRWVASFALGLAVVLAPVAIRNLAVSGQFLLTTSQLGSNFYIGNNPQADGRYQPLQPGREDARVERQDAIDLAEEDLGRRLTPSEVSSYWLARSWSHIRSEPGSWMRLLLRKAILVVNAREVVDTESIEAYQDYSRLLRSLGWFLNWGILGPLAIVGVWATRNHWRRLWILYAMELALAVSLVLFYVMARYRFPMVPIAVVFAGAGIEEIYRSVSMRSGRRILQSALVLVLVGFVQNRSLPIATYPRATTYYNLGVALYEARDLSRARGFLERALQIMPSFADGHFSLGNVLAESGEVSEAVTHYRTALALAPQHVEAHRQLARLLAQEGQTDEAMAHYRAVVEIAPADAAAHVGLAHLLIQKSQLGEATEHLERAIAIAPQLPMAHNLLANVFAQQGRREDAVEHYEAALSAEPDLADAHFKLGLLLAEQGRFDDAREHLEATTRLIPDFADAHLQLAYVLERLDRKEEAAIEYRRARELNRN